MNMATPLPARPLQTQAPLEGGERMMSNRTQIAGIAVLLLGFLTVVMNARQVYAAADANPPATTRPNTHWFCSATPSDPSTFQGYSSPQPGMTCNAMTFCVDPTSEWGVREASAPIAGLKCYDTPEEAFAAIGIDYDCSVSVSAGSGAGVSSKQCPGGIRVSATVQPPTTSPSPAESQGSSSPEPLPPGTYHVHYFCSTTQVVDTGDAQYPAPQPGMNCAQIYFCVDPTAKFGVREVSEPVATEACYDSEKEAYAAIGITLNCGIGTAGVAPGTVYYELCANGLIGSLGYCAVTTVPPGTQVGVVYHATCPVGPESAPRAYLDRPASSLSLKAFRDAKTMIDRIGNTV